MRRSSPIAYVAPLLLLSFLLAVPASPGAAAPARIPSNAGTTGMAGPVVTPRVIEFDALPRKTVEYQGPMREKVEGIFPEADSLLEILKQHPRPPGPAELGT